MSKGICSGFGLTHYLQLSPEYTLFAEVANIILSSPPWFMAAYSNLFRVTVFELVLRRLSSNSRCSVTDNLYLMKCLILVLGLLTRKFGWKAKNFRPECSSYDEVQFAIKAGQEPP